MAAVYMSGDVKFHVDHNGRLWVAVQAGGYVPVELTTCTVTSRSEPIDLTCDTEQQWVDGPTTTTIACEFIAHPDGQKTIFPEEPMLPVVVGSDNEDREVAL